MFSSFKSLLVLGCVAASAVAQQIAIAIPATNDTVSAGSNITVQVIKPDSLTGSTEVGIAISLKSCASYPGGCAVVDISQALGDILYTGLYDPEYRSGEWYPFQNFTVQVPSGFPSGQAALGVTQLALVGAGPYPYTQVTNQTINVA
ncbi:uncharacterized protein FIBRA_07658 [Fibroporia radiculosa]|uniref:Uncharacterized protein n=1 Tax=Fibroporia radiculosa TaxID=599839 RepID=J4H4R3_9APHY|nr:uncharacterized protein FIBRA_07658 [Fibroporia radiculosa]CCM05439.1 predicted protein [Fibroporia radiculosa]